MPILKCMFALGVTLFAYFTIPAMDAAYAAFGLFIALAVNTWFLTHSLTAEKGAPIAVCYGLYMCFCYIYPGILHTASGRYPFFNPGYSPDVVEAAQIVVIIFSVLFVSAYLLVKAILIRRELASTNTELALILPNYALMVGACAVVAVLAGSLAGWSDLNISRGDVTDFDTLSPIGLIAAALTRVSGFLCLLYALIQLRSRPSLLVAAVTAGAVGLFWATNNPVAIPRFLLAGYAICVLFLFAPRGRVIAWTVAICFPLAILTIFPYLSEAARGSLDSFSISNWRDYWAHHGDFDGFQSTVSVMEMVNDDGFKWGRQILSAILFFMPRSIWPGKSIGTGGEAATFMDFPFINLSAPLPSELYVDFGYPGLIFLSVVCGSLAARLDAAYMNAEGSTRFSKMLLTSMISGYIFIILRGSLVGVMGPIAVSCALIVLVNSLGSHNWTMNRSKL